MGAANSPPAVKYPAARRNLLRALVDIITEEFGHPDHWPEWWEALHETTVGSELGDEIVGDSLADPGELIPYQRLMKLIDELPSRAWQLPFGEMMRRPEWLQIRHAARDLYDALTPEPRRRLRLAARSFAIGQVVAPVFLDYEEARRFLLDELPSDEPQELMGYVLLVDEEVEGYRQLVGALRSLPDDDGKMPFPEVANLDRWPSVKQAAQSLYSWLKD